MPLPRPPEARVFYRAAQQREEDAEWLLRGGRTTGAVYVGGYAVECILKSLLLASVASGLRQKIIRSFRGAIAHEIEWLAWLYRRNVGANVPKEVARHITRVASWTTALRYDPTNIKRSIAEEFMRSVAAVRAWADGRI
jgi:HEPN domain-containing protein